MPVPFPRCIICEKVITEWQSQKGQKPKYCSEDCRALGRAHPICGRCKKPLEMEHYSQRYHEECALGCHVCGKSLRARTKGEGGGHMQAIYCSEKCQEWAWEGSTLPTCRKCGEIVPLPRPPRSLRNPPKMHIGCRPQHKREDAEAIEEKRRQVAAEKAKAAKKKPKEKATAAPKKAPWDD